MGSPTFARKKNPAGDKSGIIILLVAFLLAFFSIHNASPPAMVSRTAADTAFSAERAMDYINEIAKSPHSIGTLRNDSVKKYIHTVCDQLGLQTTIQTTTSTHSFRNIVVAGKVNNIIARIKGTNNSKAVLIMGHYDSQPNTPGAGDDAAAVGSMLETARGLKAGPALQNDIIFLFTDGEEMGILGAQAFVDDSTLLHQVGLVMNFDGRGNAGIINTFEVNPQNGWVITEFAKAAPYPVANSFSYEIYKRLPNYTDYTAFKEKDITGLNSGLIEGFVNYHSMTDVPSSLDQRSVQHYGANMIALAKHFGNIDLTQTKGADICYFNFIGNSLIHFPATWNFPFVLTTTILFIVFVYVGFRKKRINPKDFLLGILIFIAALIAIMTIAFLIEKLIKSWYPFYNRFDAGNSYNSGYYFLTISSMAICGFTLIYQSVVRKFSAGSLLAAVLFVLLILMYLSEMAMPTSVYLFFVPIFFLIVGNLIIYIKKGGVDDNRFASRLIYLISLIPAIFLFAPIVYFNFIAFGLMQTFVPVMILGILLGMLIPLLYPVLQNHRFLVTNICLAIGLFGFVAGHLTSGYNAEKPLRTNLWYRLNADSMKASWVSDFLTTDHWDRQFFSRPRQMKFLQSLDPYVDHLTNETIAIPLAPPIMKILKDSVYGSTRKLSLRLNSARNAISMNILISSDNFPKNIFVNGRQADFSSFSDKDSKVSYSLANQKFYKIAYYGLTRDGVILDLETSTGKKTDIVLIDRSMGLDSVKGFTAYPKDIIPGPDRASNTIQVVKSFSF
jgi:hypothetical protein